MKSDNQIIKFYEIMGDSDESPSTLPIEDAGLFVKKYCFIAEDENINEITFPFDKVVTLMESYYKQKSRLITPADKIDIPT